MAMKLLRGLKSVFWVIFGATPALWKWENRPDVYELYQMVVYFVFQFMLVLEEL